MFNNLPQKSALTGKTYIPCDCVFLFNVAQSARYMKHGAVPVDVFVSNNEVCFVFQRDETHELYRAWCAHTLE